MNRNILRSLCGHSKRRWRLRGADTKRCSLPVADQRYLPQFGNRREIVEFFQQTRWSIQWVYCTNLGEDRKNNEFLSECSSVTKISLKRNASVRGGATLCAHLLTWMVCLLHSYRCEKWKGVGSVTKQNYFENNSLIHWTVLPFCFFERGSK